MQSKIVNTTEDFYNLKNDWERLENQDAELAYYSTFKYNWTWWDVYKEDNYKSLFIICVYEYGEIVGIAPFIIETRSKKLFKYNVLKFMGNGDYLNILLYRKEKIEFNIIKAIFKVIENNVEKYERIQLTHIKSNSMLAAYLLKSYVYNEYFEYLVECPMIDFSKLIDFKEYKKYYISSNIMQYKNKLARDMDYKLEIINGDDKNIYDEIAYVHKKEQEFLFNEKNRKDRSSLFNDDKRNKFLKNLYKDNKNIITFVLIDKNENIISYNSCYFYKGTLYAWNEAYNPIYYKYRPSQIRYYEVVKFMCENEIPYVFDFGAGRYPWKFHWTSDFTFDYKLDMWNEKTKKGRLFKNLYKLKNHIKR